MTHLMKIMNLKALLILGLLGTTSYANHALDQMRHIEQQKHRLSEKSVSPEVKHSIQMVGQGTTRQNSITALQKDYRFVLFYMSTCPHCQRFDPILKSFSDQYGIGVTAYTVNGQSLPSFPHSVKPSQKVLTSFFSNPSNAVVPALFIINVHNLHAYPVNYGEMSYQSLVVRMQHLRDEILNHERRGEPS